MAKSIIDYIFRWLGITFLPGYKEASLGELPKVSSGGKAKTSDGESDLTEPRPVDKKSDGQVEAKSEGAAERSEAGGQGEEDNTGVVFHPRQRPLERPYQRLQRQTAGTSRSVTRRRWRQPQRPIRRFPGRRAELRQLWLDHGPQRQLLFVP